MLIKLQNLQEGADILHKIISISGVQSVPLFMVKKVFVSKMSRSYPTVNYCHSLNLASFQNELKPLRPHEIYVYLFAFQASQGISL